jgi:hypothetical protein
LKKAQVVIGAWKDYYNRIRPRNYQEFCVWPVGCR